MSFAFKYNYPQVARDSGFQLRNYKDGPLDWRLMGSMEVERILREQCLEQVDSVLDHLSEAPLGSMLETNILDGAIAKYFLLSQFSIQYLLFCRKFLEETVEDLRETHGSSQMEVATMKRSLSEANNEILQLHKKITQMEAIHEVIYPCHLCTKNFVSNDALNLHISRKHNVACTKQAERIETPVMSAKDRENDLTLINTIKLELEIKHLKERLNCAERKIKEKEATHTTSRIDCDNPGKSSTNSKSIGIQSNLSESKENDEQSEYECKYCSENAGQISVLKDKLQDLHEWKEEQRVQNSEFLAEINSKLKDFTQNQQEQKLHNNGNIPSATTSIDDLDALLSRKVEDIGKTTAAKLDAVVSKMEISYKNKLQDLEKELIKISKQSKNSDIPIRQKNVPDHKERTTPHDVKFIDPCPIVSKDTLPNNENVGEEESILPQPPLSEKSSSLSNHTFIKTKAYNLDKTEGGKKCSNDEEYTDVSDEIQDDEDSISKNPIPKIMKIQEKPVVKSSPKPKALTRRESKKLVNSRLSDLGINMKSKSLTHSSMKQISNELSERRTKLKEKHPNFYATRNKIKKFVDKLCSSKMPENAQILLQRPIKQKDRTTNNYPSSSEEEFVARRNATSTPVEEISHNLEFKQRLESILSSPIRRPDENQNRTVPLHQDQYADKPIPMPRKRVMFNHQPEMKVNETLSECESEDIPKHYKQKAHVHRDALESSLGSFL